MSVSHSKDGRWMVAYKSDGKWRYRAFRDEDKDRAFDAAMAASGTDERMSLGEVVASYLRSHPKMYEATRKRIVWLLADGGPADMIRDKYADGLTRRDLEAFRERMRVRERTTGRTVSNATMNKYQSYLRAALAWAADQELISCNPWRDMKKLKTTRYIAMPSMDVFKAVYERLNPDYRWACKTAFCLALRPGMAELFSLQWSAFQWGRGVVVRQGKSGSIKTVVPPSSYLTEAAERYRSDKSKGITLVCHRNGQKIYSFRSAWQRACKSAGVTMRPYDIRHLAATTMLANGADLAATAAQLGHASVTTTGSTYAHVTAGSQAHAAELMPPL